MNFNKIVLTLTLLFSLTSFSQKMELGNVTIEELKEKEHPRDISAAAAILFKKGNTKFIYTSDKGFVAETIVECKIKIYKKEGYDWANQSVNYYVGGSAKEIVSISNAMTYNLINGKITKDKVEGIGKIDKEINEFYKAKLVVFPNVKEGSILEFKYVIKSDYLTTLPDFQYQYDIPVNYAEYVTKIPEFYLYKSINTGKIKAEVNEKLENSSSVFSQAHENSVSGFNNGNKIYGFSYKQINSVYKATNIPALVHEPFMNNINNYYSKIENELQTIRFPDEKPKQINTTWEDLAKYVCQEEKFGKQLNTFTFFINDLKSLMAKDETDETRMKKVFDYIKNRMHWNKKYGFYTHLGIEKAYAEKTGNVADINLLLVSMLRFFSLDANPVLLSTRENGFVNFPNRTKMNYVIASVNINGKDFLLDATEQDAKIDMLPLRCLNFSGRLVKEDGSNREIDLIPKISSKENVNVMVTISPTGEISGKAQKQSFGYNAYLSRSEGGQLTDESNVEKLEKELNGSFVKDYVAENKLESDNLLIETYSFENNNSLEIINDKIYFSPLLFFANNDNPFKLEKREHPIDFIFYNQNKYRVIINIPEGYVVDSLPASEAMTFGSNLLSYKFNASVNGKQIQFSSVFDINTTLISPADYEELKMFYAEMIKKQNEKIVLKKA